MPRLVTLITVSIEGTGEHKFPVAVCTNQDRVQPCIDDLRKKGFISYEEYIEDPSPSFMYYETHRVPPNVTYAYNFGDLL